MSFLFFHFAYNMENSSILTFQALSYIMGPEI